jgi:hypothetical protein
VAANLDHHCPPPQLKSVSMVPSWRRRLYFAVLPDWWLYSGLNGKGVQYVTQHQRSERHSQALRRDQGENSTPTYIGLRQTTWQARNVRPESNVNSKIFASFDVLRNSTRAPSEEMSRTTQSSTSGGRPPVRIFAAKHTFIRNARLRSIILVGWAVLYRIVRVVAHDMPQ